MTTLSQAPAAIRQRERRARLRAEDPKRYREEQARHEVRRMNKIEGIIDAKKAGGCPCGERRLPTLDLHHRDPATKLFSFNSDTIRSVSIAAIVAEVEKCDVLCSNCHRIHHAIERGWRV